MLANANQAYFVPPTVLSGSCWLLPLWNVPFGSCSSSQLVSYCAYGSLISVWYCAVCGSCLRCSHCFSPKPSLGHWVALWDVFLPYHYRQWIHHKKKLQFCSSIEASPHHSLLMYIVRLWVCSISKLPSLAQVNSIRHKNRSSKFKYLHFWRDTDISCLQISDLESTAIGILSF